MQKAPTTVRNSVITKNVKFELLMYVLKVLKISWLLKIYKRLNRRFNVSLDTIIQKMIVDIVNNKTDINRFKNLLNNKS